MPFQSVRLRYSERSTGDALKIANRNRRKQVARRVLRACACLHRGSHTLIVFHCPALNRQDTTMALTTMSIAIPIQAPDRPIPSLSANT